MDAVIKAINDKANVNIDETYTKPVKKDKKFTSFNSMAPQMADFNHQCDVLILPKTKDGFIGLLVVKDLGVHTFDMEPIKNKESKTMLEALQNIYKRGILSIPKYSLSTDDGSEFKGVFGKWLFDKSIFHKVAQTNRHSQQASVEKQNQIISRLLNGFMNAKEIATNKPFNEWPEVLDIVRKQVNKLQKRKEINWITQAPIQLNHENEPKFKVGDVVYYKTDYPVSALGNKQPTNNFREGDFRWNVKEPRKIEKVLYYPPPINYRYLLKDKPDVSYTETQLRLSKEKESKYVVERIMGIRTQNKIKEVNIKWKGYNVSDNTWEPETNIIEDIGKNAFDDMLSQFKKTK